MLNNIFEKEKRFEHSSTNIIAGYEEKASPSKRNRTKLWELDHNYHCAIIGTCLTMDEVKKLLRSFRVNIDSRCSYEIHTAIVSIISLRDFPSKKVQSYLDKKFKVALQTTRKMNANELKKEWKRVLNNGDLIATFWAVMSHPYTNEDMKKYFYGDIHMLSHMSGASNRADLKRLNFLETTQKESNFEAQGQLIKYQKLQAENIHLQATVQQQTEKIYGLANQVEALTNANEQLMALNNVDQCRQLNLQIEKLKNKISFQKNEIEIYQKKTKHLDKINAELNHQNGLYQKTDITYKHEIKHLQYRLDQSKIKEKCQLNERGLCGQCILYVGGKSNLIPYYREMVEEKAGNFLHHDGGLEKNTHNLSDSLNRADLVVFPSDCISHDAYWKIKKACKKQQKPYKYLQSAGLHSLSSALNKVVEKI